MGSIGGNKWAIDYDKPGFCALCHEQIADFDGFNIQGNLINAKLRADARQVIVLLDDRSNASIAMCLRCFKSFNPSDCAKIWESCINGMQWEAEHGFTDKNQRQVYMKRYISKYITTRMDLVWSDEMDKEITRPLWRNLKAIPWEANQENHGRIPPWARERDEDQEGWVESLDQEFYDANEDDSILSNQILRKVHEGYAIDFLSRHIEENLGLKEGVIEDKDTLLGLARDKGGNPSKEDVEVYLKKRVKEEVTGG